MKQFGGGSQFYAVAKDILKVHNQLHIVSYQCEQSGKKTKDLKWLQKYFFTVNLYITHPGVSSADRSTLTTITLTYVCKMHLFTLGYADVNKQAEYRQRWTTVVGSSRTTHDRANNQPLFTLCELRYQACNSPQVLLVPSRLCYFPKNSHLRTAWFHYFN